MRFRSLLILLAAFIFILSSCSTEMRLAGNLQRNKKDISVLCSYPDFIYLTNSKVPLPKHLSEEAKIAFYDSLYRISDYIQFIDNTIFLRKFREATKTYFEKMGINYYEADSIGAFINREGTKYTLDYQQLEIEERWIPYHQEEQFQDVVYEEDFWINGISLNAWINVAKVNDTVEIQRQLYFESVLSDEVQGLFFQNQWTGEVHYQYELDSLQVNEIEILKTRAATETAAFLLEYIINKEIRDRLNYLENLEPNNHWIITPKGNILPD
jgi:hypothetical protein